MSAAWPRIRLGEVLRRSEEKAVPIPGQAYREVTVRLWGKGVIERSRTNGGTLSGNRFIAREGQFIISRIDARNGAMGLVPPTLDGALVTNDFPLFSIDATRLVPAFLEWLGRTRSFVELCEHASEGTTNRVRLQEDKFLALEIPLPPLSEQQRIVARIEELSDHINAAHNLRKQAISECDAFLSSGSSLVFDNAVEQFPILSLGDLVTIRGGGTPSKADPSYWNGDIPWITPKDMKKREMDDSSIHITETATQQTAAKLLPPGAVIAVVRGMILAHTFPSAVLRVNAAINQDMKALYPKPVLTPEYLCEMFWAHNSKILGLVEKSTHDTRKLETSKLLDTKIPVPPLSEQRRILDELSVMRSEVDELKHIQDETAAELDALLPAILDRAFKGEIL